MEECRKEIERLIGVGLAEDLGRGDLTTETVVPENLRAKGSLVVREEGVLAGVEVAERVFRTLDEAVIWKTMAGDGDRVAPGKVIAEVVGRARAILSSERLVLNFLQRLSGIATLTSRYVAAVAHTEAVILDTRKTTPGMRCLEKYAVRQGGGRNHRRGLYDMILVKENHLAVAGGVAAAVDRVREVGVRVEVEARTLDEVREAIRPGVDRVMLDNMSLDQMREAVRLIREKGEWLEIEASGGVTLSRVGEIAEVGVDYISVGALTHSAKALDIALSMEFV